MDNEPVGAARRLLRSLVWVLAAGLAALPLLAYFSSPVPLPVAGALAGLGLLAVSRTRYAILVVAAAGPITPTLQSLTGAPYDGLALFEAGVLIVLGGAAVRAAVRSARLQFSVFEAAIVAFMLVVAGSALAQVPVISLKTDAGDAVGTIQAFVLRDYFRRHPPLVPFERAGVLMAGAALAALISRVFQTPIEANRLHRMVMLGGAAAGALNLYRLLELSLRQPPFFESLRRAVTGLRFNTQFGDLNAAGSYFAMVSVLAMARLGRAPWAAALQAAVLVALLGGVWVSGSRVALAATVVSGIAMLLVRRFRPSMSAPTVRRLRLGVLVLLLAGFAAIVLALPLTRHTSISYSVATRIELTKIGIRMIAARPAFGVGLAQYYEQFGQFVSPELEKMFQDALGKPVPRENAHNQFVQFGAELGLIGLVAFLLVLIAAMGRGVAPADDRRPARIAALSAFLVTCLAGHPLLTGVVTLSFFIVLGLVAAGAQSAAPMRAPHIASLAVVGVILAITLPARWHTERREADLSGVSSGLSVWQQASDGTRFQWAGERATVYVPSQLTAVRISLRSPGIAPRRVQILLDGRLASGVLVPVDMWLHTHIPLPTAGDAKFRRLDLVVESLPRDTPGATQMLMLGRIGEVAPRR